MDNPKLQPDKVVNHDEAAEYAAMHPESNLARCYLALRKDADRYRWLKMKTCGLRDNQGRAYFGFPSIFGLPPVTDIRQGSVGQHLDAAIDSAALTQPVQPAATT